MFHLEERRRCCYRRRHRLLNFFPFFHDFYFCQQFFFVALSSGLTSVLMLTIKRFSLIVLYKTSLSQTFLVPAQAYYSRSIGIRSFFFICVSYKLKSSRLFDTEKFKQNLCYFVASSATSNYINIRELIFLLPHLTFSRDSFIEFTISIF